ncbi:3-oxo-5a-steroid 4- dehydrogenase [Lignoscripta atroalba]|nr:3-oxo-5a-steroid 4- dehydrogenase [Lignoscripta atroalba]
MTSDKITLIVTPRGTPIKKLPEEVAVSYSGSGHELYEQLASSAGTSVHRLRVTKGSDGTLIPNSKDVPIDKTGLLDQSAIRVKDLGPQVAWRTVFVVEYLGPLLIHPLVYILRPYIYSSPSSISFPDPSSLQTLSLVIICIHFLKRELETLFVHRFSSSTMPLRNIFKNSLHYWVLSGLNIAYWIYRPDAPTAKESNSLITYIGLLLFVIGELGNLNAHVTLRNLRSSGGKERGIPHGIGFGLVTCPNYMFETVAWMGTSLVTWSWSTVLFSVVSVVQMIIWAQKREKSYRREFGDKYKRKRYSMLPGII